MATDSLFISLFPGRTESVSSSGGRSEGVNFLTIVTMFCIKMCFN